MTKNILQMLIRISIISALLYSSYYIYNHYTGIAIQMIDFDGIRISLIIHSLIFFLIGIVLKFDARLISCISKRTIKLNKIKLIIAIFSLIVLLYLKYNVFMYISIFIAFLVGVFTIESFECA